MNCKNCNEALNGQEKFCSNCGQKNIDRLNLKYIFSQFVEDIFNVDSKVFRTIKYLSLKPGFLTKEYIDGKRVHYVPPIRLYIVISVLFFFLISVIEFGDASESSFSFSNVPEEQAKIDGVTFTLDSVNIVIPTSDLKRMDYEGNLDEGLDSLTAEMPEFAAYVSKKVAMMKINDEQYWDMFNETFSLFLLLFLPFFSLLYATVFSGSKKGFVGHLMFNLHLNSFIIFSLMIFLLVDLLITNELIEYAWILLIALFGQFYLIKAVMVFYDRKWWIAIYKYFLLVFGYLILALLFIGFVFSTSLLLI